MTAECPTCTDSFESEYQMKMHHVKKHGESLSYQVVECGWCGVNIERPDWRVGDRNHFCRDSDCRERYLSQKYKGRSRSEDTKAKISETLMGRTRPEEDCEKISEALEGRSIPEEVRQKMSRNTEAPRTNMIEVDETGNVVRSGWEAEIDVLLDSLNVDYGYEPKKFELDGRHYIPDFVVGDIVIEVKGFPDERAEEQAELFMQEYPEYEYVVVGSQLPCDTHIPWEERSSLGGALA